jgi:hypothetical protein
MRVSFVNKELHLGWIGAAFVLLLMCWSLVGISSDSCFIKQSVVETKEGTQKSTAVPSLDGYISEQANFCTKLNSAATKPATAEEVNSILRNLGDGYTAAYHQIPSGASISGVPFVQYVYSGNADTVSSIYNHGQIQIWEEHVVRQLDWAMKNVPSLARFAQKKPILLDIGANVGAMTLQMAAAGYQVRYMPTSLESKGANTALN